MGGKMTTQRTLFVARVFFFQAVLSNVRPTSKVH